MQGMPVSVSVGSIRERGYDQARRHSALVRFLRRALPLGALLAALLLIVLPYIRPLELISADIDLGSLTLDGTRITMEMPDLKGFRGDNKPYSISARQAIQDVTRPNILELVELTSRIETKPGSVARLRSDAGIYDSKKDELSVKGKCADHFRDVGYSYAFGIDRLQDQYGRFKGACSGDDDLRNDQRECDACF